MWYRVLLHRLALAALTLIGVAVVVFVLVRVVPGDPVSMMIAPGASDADVEALRARYGLDKTLPEQFLIWVKSAIGGDFGTSISLRQDVAGLVLGRLPATLELAFMALVIAIFIGGAIAVVGTIRRNSWLENVLDNVNGISLAVPDFIWALTFVLVFGVLVPILPVSGRADPRVALDFTTQFHLIESILRARFEVTVDLLRHMLMPSLALGLPLAAVIARVLKGALKEAMVQDYVTLARIRGLSETRIVLREALRNAIVPTLTLTGVQFTFLIGGTVIVERIFSYPGIGNMGIDAVINRDLPLIQGLVLAFGLIFILINLAVDLTAHLFNPRLRHG